MAALRNLMKFPFKNLNNLKTDIARISVNYLSVHTPQRTAYESDGRTVVNILNSEENAPLMINSYSMVGFRLNNGAFVVGPLAIFPYSVLSWNVKDDFEINERSLSLFLRLYPKLDMLLIGLSDPNDQKLLQQTRENVKEIVKGLKKGEKINVEIMPTEKAVTTFNFLNQEKRFVAAALLPPTNYSPTLDDQYRIDYLSKQTGDEYLLPSLK